MSVRRVPAARLAALLGPRAGDRPAYRWLADGIRLLVADGRVLPETALPSERALTEALGVSRTTVSRAYAELVEQGYAEARRGSGTRTRLPGSPPPGGREPYALSTPYALATTWGGEEDAAVADLTSTAAPAVPGLLAAVERATQRLPRYLAGGGYHPVGLPELREVIAEGYAARGVPTSPDEVIVTGGALAAVAAVLRTFVGAGDRVVVESPAYPNSIAALHRQGARPLAVPMGDDGFDVASLVDAAHAARAGLLVPDFQNPTGHLLDDAGRGRLVAGFRRARVPLVVDETHADVALDDLALPAATAAYGPVVSVGSCSKSHWGGVRLGWVRAPRRQLAAIQQARLSLDLGAPVLEQLVLADLLRQPPADDRRLRFRTQRDHLHRRVREELPGWTARVPAGGLSLWWRLPAPRSTALAAAAARRGVRMVPGSAFSPEGTGLEGHLRLPFTQPVDVLDRAIDVLAHVWPEVAGRHPIPQGVTGKYPTPQGSPENNGAVPVEQHAMLGEQLDGGGEGP